MVFGWGKKKDEDVEQISWIKQGDSEAEHGRFEEAIACYDKAIRLDPEVINEDDKLQMLIQRAEELEKSQRFEELIQICELILKIIPKDITLLSKIMTSHLTLWRPDEAIFWADKILEIDKNNLFVLAAKASALADKHLMFKDKDSGQESKICLEKILTIDKNNLRAMMGMCMYYSDMEKLDDAMKWCDKSLEIDENWENTNSKGGILLKMEKLDDAMKWFDKSLKYAEISSPMLGKSMIFFYHKDYANATLWCDKALELDKNSLSAQNIKKLIQEKLDQI